MPIAQNQFVKRSEFIALMAMIFATTAFSIDAMLPAIPQIADEIAGGNRSHAAWVLTSFVAGMGLGTFFAGPLSDAFGRKPIVYAGAVVYIVSAAAAWATSSLEWILVARFIQGIGASGPRVVSIAIVRDLFQGREMARIMSIAMTIFILVPAIAPAMGALIINSYGWRSIFAAFILFSLVSTFWISMRLNEPLAVNDRRPIRMHLMIDAVKQMLTHKTVRISILMQTIMLAMLFTTLTMIQPIYDQIYGRAESFPFWFGMVALFSGTSSLLNAFIVTRFGMHKVITWAITFQVIIGGMVLVTMSTVASDGFYLFIFWQFCLFAQAGLTMGNLNAIAMEPMGHIAGMAASVIGAISTIAAAMIASPASLLFTDTARPLIAIVLVLGIFAVLLMRRMNQIERAI
ncbi:MAG: DHA1 family bicyclomycin/chloramphenicol resistance-like MFS transporter [Ascidiaceihabitans sp.]|jgi:DHA1 family bicyclomycin/chloramphenicol resistance-like MFS transporter|tara:strand:+ start:5298 stop:6506 length:1209 start_codon:yes stop_codon:yes gene_type:complete